MHLYSLVIHPDFLWSQKDQTIRLFFLYSNEGLHLSDQEKRRFISVFQMIEEELDSRIDDHSQDVIISQIELLLSYADLSPLE